MRKPLRRTGVRAPATKHGAADVSFRDFVLDQLAGTGDVTSRAMFGGYGLYLGGAFFGIVHRGRLYFRVHSATLTRYERHGSQPFEPYGKPMKGYYEVPAEVLEDVAEVRRWARESVKGAGSATSPRRSRSSRGS